MAPDAVVFILYYSEICKKSIDNEVALDACTKAFTFEVEFNLEDLQKKKSLLKKGPETYMTVKIANGIRLHAECNNVNSASFRGPC